jgi:hypothetical protein
MRRFLIPTLLTIALVLAACSSASSSPQADPQLAPVSNMTATPTDDPALIPTLFPDTAGDSDMTRIDEQGAVVVEVTLLNLGTPAETLDFSVTMNTHSVDLNLDLATLSTLVTDTGSSARAILWEAPRGGHHVEGRLIFPATKDGKSVLEGATKLTLTILNVDAPSRVFEWELN